MLWIDDEVEPGNPIILLLRDEAVAIDLAQTAAEGHFTDRNENDPECATCEFPGGPYFCMGE